MDIELKTDKTNILEVKNMTVSFATARGYIQAVRQLSFAVGQNEILAIVGESGSGKSVSNLALMGLLAANSQINVDEVILDGKSLNVGNSSETQAICGSLVSMIFQDPMTSLNPCFTIGFQLMETFKRHGLPGNTENTRKNRKKEAIELLKKVGIAEPEKRLKAYPHQLSGGMCQRAMIAMAIACRPKLLIADEPTTALDVTIQAQILELLAKMREMNNMSMILITHDMGVAYQYADRIMVMYAGEAVEIGSTEDIVHKPQHPYTEGLLSSIPGITSTSDQIKSHLPSIPGVVPDLIERPDGCQLHPRCKYAKDECRQKTPELLNRSSRSVKCHYPITYNGSQNIKKEVASLQGADNDK